MGSQGPQSLRDQALPSLTCAHQHPANREVRAQRSAHRSSSRLGWEVACGKFKHVPLAGTRRIQKGQDKTKSKPGLNVDSMGDVAHKNVAHRAPTTGSITDRGPQL